MQAGGGTSAAGEAVLCVCESGASGFPAFPGGDGASEPGAVRPGLRGHRRERAAAGGPSRTASGDPPREGAPAGVGGPGGRRGPPEGRSLRGGGGAAAPSAAVGSALGAEGRAGGR